MDQDDQPFFGCKFFDDTDTSAPAPDTSAPAPAQPWTFNPTVPQPPNFNLNPLNLPPGLGLKPGEGNPNNPLLQKLPLPFGPNSAPPEGPPSLFDDNGQIPIPVPRVGPLRLIPPFIHPFVKPFDDDPDPRQQRQPFTDPRGG
jgi:hypothetical protein